MNCVSETLQGGRFSTSTPLFRNQLKNFYNIFFQEILYNFVIIVLSQVFFITKHYSKLWRMETYHFESSSSYMFK